MWRTIDIIDTSIIHKGALSTHSSSQTLDEPLRAGSEFKLLRSQKIRPN